MEILILPRLCFIGGGVLLNNEITPTVNSPIKAAASIKEHHSLSGVRLLLEVFYQLAFGRVGAGQPL